jgi:hypothetical protein
MYAAVSGSTMNGRSLPYAAQTSPSFIKNTTNASNSTASRVQPMQAGGEGTCRTYVFGAALVPKHPQLALAQRESRLTASKKHELEGARPQEASRGSVLLSLLETHEPAAGNKENVNWVQTIRGRK